MFGRHRIPYRFKMNGISLSLWNHKTGCQYIRTLGEERVEKRVLTCSDHIIICPVEPVNLPKEIASYLYLHIENPVMLEPNSKHIIYVKFPVEIGVFIKGNGVYANLDVLTLAPQKLTMYGEPPHAIICKHYSTRIFNRVPKADPHHEGIMEIEIHNHTGIWVELTQAVLNALGMKIYYSDDLVSLRAKMNVRSERVAETTFVNEPLKPGLKKGIELYAKRMIAMKSSSFVMEAGI